MTVPTAMSDDEAAVRALIEQRADALRSRSASATLATQSPGYVQFPLTGALQYAGDGAMTAAELDAVFASFAGPIGYQTSELEVSVGDRVAVSRSLSRITATPLSGDPLDLWFRKTLVFEKAGGRWSITHEHESVPMASVADRGDPPADTAADRHAALARGFDGFQIRSVTREGTTIGYRVAGTGPAVLLVHGWPQTGYEWHRVAADLARDHRVVVPDYRGAAGSDKPENGYDKVTMAADLAAVLTDAGVRAAHVVGHDIGMMVAYAFARRHRAATTTLTLMDGVVPGTPMTATFLSSLGPWHFGLHSQVELATALVEGRERAYLDHFFDAVTVDPASVPDDDRAFYARAAQAPGALAAGFRTYAAATSVDGVENERVLAADGKLTLPVLGIGGAASLGPWLDALIGEVATDLRTLSVDGAGHFVPDEQPAAVAAALRAFVAEHPA